MTDAMPASGGRLIQHPSGKYARRLCAVSNLPTSRPPSRWAGTSWNEEATMSKFNSDDLGMLGYFLPEDSQFRLKKLHDHMVFLSQLAQPRTHDEDETG
ncbi:XAC0095 family protein, partial [Luteimonas suaedae]|uniref:XAC0095 family protein n=1 Tax=Luteimonas suaedae TaxID=2605430 RepID=UPI003CCDBEB5